MTPPLPKPPAVLFAVFGILTAGALSYGARFDQDDWGGRFAHDLSQILAGIFAALLVGGGVVRYWQGRKWMKRTRMIALDLVGEAMRDTAVIASQALHVLGGRDSITTIDLAFRLPWKPARAAHAAKLEEMAQSILLAPLHADESATAVGAAFREMDERAVATAGDMDQRIGKLRSLGLELGPYLHGDPIELVNQTVEMRKRARVLIGPLPGSRVPGQMPAGKAAAKLVTESIKLAQLLGEEEKRIRAHATEADATVIAGETARTVEWESFEEELESARRDFERLKEEIEQSTREFQCGLDWLDRETEGGLEDVSPEQRQAIGNKMGQIEDILSDAESAPQAKHLPETEPN